MEDFVQKLVEDLPATALWDSKDRLAKVTQNTEIRNSAFSSKVADLKDAIVMLWAGLNKTTSK